MPDLASGRTPELTDFSNALFVTKVKWDRHRAKRVTRSSMLRRIDGIQASNRVSHRDNPTRQKVWLPRLSSVWCPTGAAGNQNPAEMR